MTMVAIADHLAPLMVFSRKLILVRRFVHETFEDGQKNNLDIEPEAPLADVLQIELDAFFHFFQRVGFAAPAVDLRPAGDARLHLMAQHVAFNQRAVLLVMRHRVRTRANNRHPAGKDVDKLRQLVQRGAAQEVPHAGDARIVLRGLGHHLVVLHHLHGAEFPHHNRLTVHAVAGLTEDNRSWRAQLHREGNAAQHRGDEQQNQRREHDIFQTLQHAVNTGQRRVVQRYDRHPVHLFNTGVKNVEGKHIRDQDH